MDEFDDIGEFYNEQVNRFSDKPADDVWNRLDKNLSASEMGVEEWYKQKVNELSVPPSAGVWDDLSINLDTENVWTRLLKSLRKRDKIIFWWRFGLGGTAILSLVLIVFFWKDSEVATFKDRIQHGYTKQVAVSPVQEVAEVLDNPAANSTETTNPTITTEANAHNIDLNHSIVNYTSSNDDNINSVNVNQGLDYSDIQDESNLVTEESASSEVVNTTDDAIVDYTIVHSSVSSVEEEDEQSVDNLADISVEKYSGHLAQSIDIPLNTELAMDDPNSDDNPIRHKHEFYVYGGITNSWFINSDTYYSLRANSLTYTVPRLTEAFGVGYTHWIVPNGGLDINMSYQRKGHNYMEFIEGHSFARTVDLKYVVGNINYKQEVFGKNKDPFKDNSTYIIGGVYYGYSFKETLMAKGVTYTNQGLYKKHDFGISLGLEKRHGRLSGTITLTQGLMNLYNDPYHTGFNNTYNFSAMCSIKYILVKK